ncbi:glycoside hydrolase family 57 protein [Hydrogenothermus marinus]|uniref:Alpha-amylase/alpha-mannosidase (GH57 family) n=1 Tax=Hydrogenothermus marinus TaxID=133270 RepID=A0A3M0BMK1_9AQUI|nr:glycoside hydrolase family 57 protein [Hydrogenothermus marinus]RMA97704.1 alpha-amylase/alpha-mannosidase (GH57 family) [Hydrogenothermus marinus]
MLTLNFIWHMHQPSYLNEDGIMHMPWVFLHSIKDYFDMPFLVSKFENIKATFNLTPTLIEQILLYEEYKTEKDKFLILLKKDTKDLTKEEKNFIIKICKSSPYKTMVEPYERYKELYQKDILNNKELLDLEVIYLLSWTGNYLKENSEVVKELLKKGKNFTSEDKNSLIEELINFIPKILPFYKKLQEEGKISISTTPYFHPILPLLIDINVAKEADKNIKLPKNPESLKEDAILHIKKAKKLYEEIFGIKPNGFWPAEGAVDEKSIFLYIDEDIKWIATDEAILFKSLKDNNRKNLYKLYNHKGIKIVFRDHNLSDLIGFVYKFWDFEKAVNDFITHLKNINNNFENSIVSVILDGENPWEYYKNNGKDFLNKLYEEISSLDFCKTKTMDEILSTEPKNLENIKPGSWIYGNFNTWIGDEEKNKAWELIFQTKRDFKHHLNELNEDTIKQIEEEFLKSECSDWFWWYGKGHFTKFNLEFDFLFRNHLIKIYKLIGLPVPSNLYIPIAKSKNIESFVMEPKSYISPVIDGKETSFFEWLDSGLIDEEKAYTTMQKQKNIISKIYWGEDEENIYLRLDGDIKKLKGSKINIFLREKNLFSLNTDKNVYEDDCIKMAINEIVEIAIKKKCINQQLVYFRIEIQKDNNILQVLPGITELKINLNEDFKRCWFV